MKKLALLTYLFCSIFLSGKVQASSLSLKNLLQIKPGSNLTKLKKDLKGLELSATTKDYSYELEVAEDKVVAMTLSFTKVAPHSTYLNKNSKGYCLVQGLGGDINLNRFFFFNQEGNRRYEITHDQKIKSILIKEMTFARENKPCNFSELVKLGSSVHEVKKVQP